VKLVKIRPGNRILFRDRIAALEAIATYPLGADSFQIDHGNDYFRFFERLGGVHYYTMNDGERVAAVAAGVLRRVPERTWYLCDLKVHPDYRGQRLPLKILSRAFIHNYLRCPRGYCVSMNPADGRPNRIARLLEHFRWAPARIATELRIYSLDAEAMRKCEPVLRKHRGKLSYLSLTGIKDIILGSTGKPMPLLHAQFGPCAELGTAVAPLEGYTHMFPAPNGDPMIAELRALGVEPHASASVIAHRMQRSDWKFILTSDI
jgi:hypothetical protein